MYLERDSKYMTELDKTKGGNRKIDNHRWRF